MKTIENSFNNTIWYPENVIDWWTESLLNSFKNKELNFSIFPIPWVREGLDVKKVLVLWSRSILVAPENSSISVPYPWKEFIDFYSKSIDGILEKPEIIYNNTSIVDKNGVPYGYFKLSYDSVEWLEPNLEKLRKTEYFNNKIRFLRFAKEIDSSLIQEGTEFSWNRDDTIKRMFELIDKGNTFFVKSAIGASWAWTWKISNKEELVIFIKESENFISFQSLFDEEANLMKDLHYDKKECKWQNTRWYDVEYIIQPEIDTSKLEEMSVSFYFEKGQAKIITETYNYTDSQGIHQWNKKCVFDYWIREKLSWLISEVSKKYEWVWGIDFFVDKEEKEIYLLEMNPRNTWATNPEILTYKISEKIGECLTWEVIHTNDSVKFWKNDNWYIIPQSFNSAIKITKW